MKSWLIILSLLCLSLQSQSQSRKYSKKELRELVRLQQKRISELLLVEENVSGELLLVNGNLAKLSARFHTVEEEKFRFFAEKQKLGKIINEKDTEIAAKNREKELLLLTIKDLRAEVGALKKTVVSSTNSSSVTPSPSFFKASKSIQPYRERYHERTKTYITGPRGGCYYINGNGNKTYVDRSLCH